MSLCKIHETYYNSDLFNNVNIVDTKHHIPDFKMTSYKYSESFGIYVHKYDYNPTGFISIYKLMIYYIDSIGR